MQAHRKDTGASAEGGRAYKKEKKTLQIFMDYKPLNKIKLHRVHAHLNT